MKKIIVFGIVAVVIGAGIFLGISRSKTSHNNADEDLGFSYLTITPVIAAYYNLALDHGALVTEVVPASQADRAGIKPGDILLSFNGVKVDEGVPLLGMMRACRVGNRVVMEVWREGGTLTREMLHGAE